MKNPTVPALALAGLMLAGSAWAGERQPTPAPNGKPVVRDYLTSTELAANARWTVFSATARPGAVDVTQQVRTPEGTFLLVDRTFRWTRQGFVADRPLPFFPEADAQP